MHVRGRVSGWDAYRLEVWRLGVAWAWRMDVPCFAVRCLAFVALYP